MSASTRFAFLPEMIEAVTRMIRVWFSRLMPTAPTPRLREAKFDRETMPFAPRTYIDSRSEKLLRSDGWYCTTTLYSLPPERKIVAEEPLMAELISAATVVTSTPNEYARSRSITTSTCGSARCISSAGSAKSLIPSSTLLILSATEEAACKSSERTAILMSEPASCPLNPCPKENDAPAKSAKWRRSFF